MLIDGKAGGNMIYLPIDKLLEKSNAQAGEPQSAEQAAAAANAGAQGGRPGDGRGARAGRTLMNARHVPVFIGLLALLIVAGTSMFTVSATEYAIRKEFGAIVGTRYEPGLHFKWPWDTVTKFDSRILSQSYTGETFLTNDGRGLIVDFYIKWRVKDPSLFFTDHAVGDEGIAGERLSEIVKDGIKTVVAQRTLQQIVSSERAAVTGEMLGQASVKAAGLGADLIDVRVQRIDLPEDVAARIYESMKQSFVKIANSTRAEGQKESATIRSSAERQRTGHHRWRRARRAAYPWRG